MIRGIAHVCFLVADLDLSLRFYCGGLGLQRAFDFHDEEGRRTGCYLRIGGRSFLELFEAYTDLPGESQRFQHLCLEVDDLPATVEELRGRGVEVSDPVLGGDRAWQSWITDPDGNRIELHAYTPESLQTPHLE